MRPKLADRAKYRLPDGRELIVLAFDFHRLRYRVIWTKPEHRHEDVDAEKLEDAELVQLYDRGVK